MYLHLLLSRPARASSSVLPHLLQGSVGVGAHPVQFVDECEEGDIIALHLPVNCHGLTLNSSYRAQHQHSAIQHSQCSLHLNGKVHVAWRLEEDRDIWRKVNNLLFVMIWIGPASWHGGYSALLAFQSVIAGATVPVFKKTSFGWLGVMWFRNLYISQVEADWYSNKSNLSMFPYLVCQWCWCCYSSTWCM